MSYLKQKAENLFPAYFALVMTSGALSIGTHLLQMLTISKILLIVNVIAYISLWVLTLIRLLTFFPKLAEDLTSHEKGPGFFTLVAGTCVFGSQIITVTGNVPIAFSLWVLGVLLWVIVMYTFFTSVTIRSDKPTLAEGINGAWLIAAVATQSVSILGTLISPHIHVGQEILLFFTLCMYFLGCMLYLNIITLIFYRFTFLKLKFSALTPPYWINMEALAITSLAGSTLILHAEQMNLLLEITPFLKGFTTFFWATGTWWIPLLFILMMWRYVIHHYPLNYDPQLWGMAFPLAMYTTSTFQLSKALGLPFLSVISHIMVYIAMLVWLFVFVGLLRHIYEDFRVHQEKTAKRLG